MRIKTVALGTVHTEALQFTLLVDETQSVAIGERRRTSHIERVTPYLLDIAHMLAHRLGRIGGEYSCLPAMQEVSGETTIEGLVEIRRESIGTIAP